MGLRKHGSATGDVIGVEAGGLARQAAREQDGKPWDGQDDDDLKAENDAADKGDD